MKHLTPQQLTQLEAALSKRHSELVNDINSELMNSDGSPVAENILEFIEQNDNSIEHLVTQITLEEIRKYVSELRAVERAKARIHDTSFGLCNDCSQEITFERLNDTPTAIRCASCLHSLSPTNKTV